MKLKMILISIAMFALCAVNSAAQISSSPTISAESVKQEQSKTSIVSPTPTVTLQDLQVIRTVVAERDSLIKENDVLKTENTSLKDSNQKWQNLYNQEKYRADVVQEKRISELKLEAGSLRDSLIFERKANTELHNQHKDDMDRIATLDFENKKLRSQRWQFGLTGAAIGGAGGFAAGFALGNRTSTANINLGNRFGDSAGNRLISFQF